MLRAVALAVSLCAVFGLVLYVYYSADTVSTQKPPAMSTQFEANYRALAKLTWIDFSFANPQIGWLVLGNRQNYPDDGRILATRDGGKTWYVQLALPVSNVQFVDDHNGWAYVFPQLNSRSSMVTPEEAHAACQCLLVTHDGGQSWEELPPGPKNLQYFDFVDDQVGWAVTGTTAAAGFESSVFRTRDGAVSWQESKLPSEIASSPAALLSSKDESTAWLSFCAQSDCAQRALAVTYDGGVTWKSLGSPCASSGEALARFGQYFIGYYLSESEWWLLCSVGDQQATELYRTADGGGHWVLAAESNGSAGLPALGPLLSRSDPAWGDIGFVDPNDGWIAVGGPSGGPFVTRDGGETWKDTRPFDVAANKASFLDDHVHGWALTGDSLLSTDDGGASWKRIYPPQRR